MSNDRFDQAATLFEQSLDGITSAIKSAVGDYELVSSDRANTSYADWKGRALSILSSHLETVRSSLADANSPSGIEQILPIADSDVHLAKNLDGFHFDFAGPAHEQALHDAVRKVVFAASDLLDEASSARRS